VILLHVRVRPKPEKRREFIQSARSLAALEGALYQAVDDQNLLLLVEHWDLESEAQAYAESDAYRALRGALCTLCEESELEWVRGIAANEALKAQPVDSNRGD
jgi:quinol monooxygenase YgiN